MKKIAIVLFMALALVSFATAQAKVTGEFDYGMMADSSNFTGAFTVNLDLTAALDDYNTFALEMEAAPAGSPGATLGSSYLDFSFAEVTTDWGKMLSLPVGLTTTTGYDGFGYLDDGVTGWGFEDVVGAYYLTTGAATTVALKVNDMVSAMFAYNYMSWSSTPAIVGATIAVDPVTVKVAYDMESGSQAFGTEVISKMDVAGGMMDMMGAFNYNLEDNPADGSVYSQWAYGVGVAFSVAGAKAGVSMNGNDNDALADLGLDLNYALTDKLSATAATRFNMRDAATDNFLGLDTSVTYAAGAVKYTLGYLYSDGDGAKAAYNSEADGLADGGIYMNVCLTF